MFLFIFSFLISFSFLPVFGFMCSNGSAWMRPCTMLASIPRTHGWTQSTYNSTGSRLMWIAMNSYEQLKSLPLLSFIVPLRTKFPVHFQKELRECYAKYGADIGVGLLPGLWWHQFEAWQPFAERASCQRVATDICIAAFINPWLVLAYALWVERYLMVYTCIHFESWGRE